jgi:hypothetical protein
MILLEIDAIRIAVLELEGDAPWSVDMDGITGRGEAPQRVEVETRQIHVVWAF